VVSVPDVLALLAELHEAVEVVQIFGLGLAVDQRLKVLDPLGLHSLFYLRNALLVLEGSLSIKGAGLDEAIAVAEGAVDKDEVRRDEIALTYQHQVPALHILPLAIAKGRLIKVAIVNQSLRI